MSDKIYNKYLPFVEKYKANENLEISNYATTLAEGIKQLLAEQITIDGFEKIEPLGPIDGLDFDIGCLNYMRSRVIEFTE